MPLPGPMRTRQNTSSRPSSARAAFTRSRPLVQAPPLVRSASQWFISSAAASLIWPASSSTTRDSQGMPCRPSQAARATRLLAYTAPRGSGSPGAITSRPVARSPTLGRGWAGTWDRPAAARRPTVAGSRRRPLGQTTSPAATSEPASMTLRPGSAVVRQSTAPSSSRVNSTAITASAPAGRGAPVVIRIAWPGARARSVLSPAATEPIIASRTGLSGEAVASSAPRTAKPSLVEAVTEGEDTRATTLSPATRPHSPAKGVGRGGSTGTRSATRARASARPMKSPMDTPPGPLHRPA